MTERYIEYDFINDTGVARAGTSTINTVESRYKGVPEEELLRELCGVMGFNYDNLATCKQIHGSNVVYVSLPERENIVDADALITDVSEKPIAVFTADCVPGVVLDRDNHAVGVFHGGWKGTLLNIAKRTLLAMKKSFKTDASKCLIVIGPSIGPCCYIVEDDIAEQFIKGGYKDHVPKMTEGFHLDLPSINIEQLTQMGVERGNIDFFPVCTYEANSSLYSHRRENKDAGRMITIIELE